MWRLYKLNIWNTSFKPKFVISIMVSNFHSLPVHSTLLFSLEAHDTKILSPSVLALHLQETLLCERTQCKSLLPLEPVRVSRGSSTNDKVGTVNVLLRLSSVRAIKENFVGKKSVP